MMPLRAYIEWSVRRDVDRAASLRIRRQFSPGYLILDFPLLPMQAEAASILPEAATAEERTGDMHRRPSVYALRGIIGAHISAKMSRYARPTLGIRLQWHHQGAYLRNESEVEKQASKSPEAARCATDREQAGFVSC